MGRDFPIRIGPNLADLLAVPAQDGRYLIGPRCNADKLRAMPRGKYNNGHEAMHAFAIMLSDALDIECEEAAHA